MKTTIQLLTFIILGITLSYGQNISKNISSKNFNTIPTEKVYVHQNSTLIISGEYIFYKFYCINNKTNSLSNISKIGYLEIVNENKQVVLKQKITLSGGQGQGQGDIFIPTTIPSGNYKLIAYTQWMKNNKGFNFFQNDIAIINPYLSNQHHLFKEPIEEKTPLINTYNNINQTNDVNINLDSDVYSTRKKVTLAINSLKKDFLEGSYSISVKSIGDMVGPSKNTSKTYETLFKNTDKLTPLLSNDSIYLPEMRGELLQGKIVTKKANTPAANIKVSLSIPGKKRLFKIATTNKNGVFYFNLDKEYDGNDAFFQIFNNEREGFKILLNNQPSINYGDLVFNNFELSSKLKNAILQRSIHNQIENAYFKAKPDSIKSIKSTKLFQENKIQTYLLDDFTRFPTLKETIIEIIPEIVIKKTKEHSFFKVKFESKYDVLPLVLFDGVLIQKHDDIINYDSHKISQISFLKEEYIYGSERFNGIILIETKDGSFKSKEYGDHVKNITLSKPQTIKKYYNQTYKTGHKHDRIPDYRSQLFWNPNVKLDGEKTILIFYTSDSKGQFEVCLEGFSKKGKAVSLKKIITVK